MNSIKEIIYKNNYLQFNACVDISKVFANNNFLSREIYIKKKIHFGLNMYKNENKLSIKNTFVKIINESFTIYFFKNILFNEYGSIYSCNKYISNLLQPIKSYILVYQITQYLGLAIYHSIINVLTKIVPLLNSINYFPYSKIHIHNNSAITNYIKMLGIK